MKRSLGLIIIAVLIAAIAGGYFYIRKPQAPLFDVAKVKRGNILQEVNVTGRVKPSREVDLAFEKSGRVEVVSVKVGDNIGEGKILVSLSQTDLRAQLAEANAKVESARAQLWQYQAAGEREEITLAELKRGTRSEEIQIVITKAANAKKTLDDASLNLAEVNKKATVDLKNLYDDVKDILNDAYTQGDDAVNKQLGEVFSDASLGTPKLTFSTDPQEKINAEAGRLAMTEVLKQFKAGVDALSTEYTRLDEAMNKTEIHLQNIRDFLSTVNSAVNKAVGLSATTANTYRANITTGRNNVNKSLSSISSQRQLIAAQKITNQNSITAAQTKVNDAKSALLVAQDELALKEAGTTSEQIQAQEAQLRQAKFTVTSQEALVKQAQTNVQNIQAQIEKTILKSPITGLVTKQDAKVGEIVAANVTTVSVISQNDVEIEAHIPEADIAKIAVGNNAKVTLDAYGENMSFNAHIVRIDPAETIIEGVATYKITLEFLTKDERIKPGLTANIDVLADMRENVLAIPQRALVEQNGKTLVRLVNPDNTFREVQITTGLRGSDGMIEIIQGLQEGETVITFLRQP